MKLKMLKLISVFAVLGIMAPNFSLAIKPEVSEINPRDKWQYYKDINIGGNPQNGDLVKIMLDEEVFDNSREDLADLRIYAGYSEVPYKLIIEKGIYSQENIYPAQLLNNSFISGQYNLFIIDLGQKGYLNSSLRIITSSENFRRQAEISGSDDMGSWNVLKADGYIYDYTDKEGNFKAQNTSINYSENAYRYLQVKIFTGEGEPIAISGAQVSKIIKTETKETVLLPKYEVTQNQKNKTTEIVVDLKKKGWPTNSVMVGVSGENFNRSLGIFESADEASWQNIGSGYIFSYNTPKFRGSSLNVDYAESGKRFLKIEIYNGNDAPLSISGITTKTILRNLVFQYKPGENYALYYGNGEAQFPEYDLERIFPYLDTGAYASAKLLEEKRSPEYQDKPVQMPPITERMPYLLDAILIIAVAIMGFVVFKFMKKSSPKN